MKNYLKLIIQFAKPHKGKFALLFFGIISTTFLSAAFPYLFGKMIDEVFYTKSMDRFFSIALIYGITYLVNQLLHFALNMSWVHLWTDFLFDIRRAIFTKVLSMKGKELSGLYTGDVINRMDADTNQFMNFIHWNVFYNIGGILRLLLSIGFIYYYNWKLAIIVILLTPISVYISRIFAQKLKRIQEEMKKKQGLMSSWLFEIVKGIQDIKLLCATRNVLAQYTGRMAKITRLQVKASKVEVVSERINTGMSLIAQLFLYVFSALLIIKGEFTIGGFTAVVSYFGTCVLVFRLLNERINAIGKNTVSIGRVAEILEKESETENIDNENFEINHGNIQFKDVFFNYQKNVYVLNGINFGIKSGEVISIVGFSGAGKTTLVNLIYKLYEIDRGTILIDGKDINDFNLHNLRAQIGIVHQDTYIYDATLRYNLIFSDEKNRDSEIVDALKRAHLSKYYKSLVNGLDTALKTSNTALSGGQRQRLAIARIFLKNPRILIFDEATSSLDFEAETIIKEAWNDLCKNRTILVIAHRLSTIINSDKIAVLDGGQIVGFDSHQELLENNDLYKKLFKEQYFKAGENYNEKQ